MTTAGGLGHALPYLIPDFWTATTIAGIVVFIELWLIAWIQKNAPLVKLRPDHRVIVQRVWKDERQRLSGVTGIVSALAKLAGAAAAPAEPALPAARSAAASR